jgi:FkbM family methyltransferase|tara:strand:+ start:84 stop:758 length:675 start_codon:yes stop_codon:yes gene_type:complete
MKDKKVHFIDCGSNVGIAIDWAKERYKDNLLKVDAFEPELKNYDVLLSKCYKEKELDLSIHLKAVWIRDEIKKFFVQHWGTRTGSSIMKNKEQVIKTGQILPPEYLGLRFDIAYNPKEMREDGFGNKVALTDVNAPKLITFLTQCIDMSGWIKKNVNKENYNVLKIDIEGAEYEVIKHLLETGAHEYIDEWLVEFTSQSKVPEDYDQEVVDKFKSTITNYKNWR